MKAFPVNRTLRWLLVCLGVLLLADVSAGEAATLHVRPGGSNSAPGTSWAEAKASVDAALTVANPDDEVWVAAGTYVTHAQVRAGVGLYGGFAGNEVSRDQRDWTANETILDGANQGWVLTTLGPSASPQRIDGFTIQHGNRAISTDYSSPIITNNRIIDNGGGWGSGIGGTHSSPVIQNNYIARNSSLGDGGGILFIEESSPKIERNTIVANSAIRPVGSEYGGSGGGALFWRCASVTFIDNVVEENRAQYSGGGVTLLDTASWTFRGNRFAANSGTIGALEVSTGDGEFSGNVVTQNEGAYLGGAAFGSCTNLRVARNSFLANHGGIIAGVGFWFTSGVIADNEISGNLGPDTLNVGGLHLDQCDVRVAGNLVSGNGSGLAYTSAVNCLSSTVVLDRNVIRENSGSRWTVVISRGNASFSNSLVARNVAPHYPGLVVVGATTRVINNTLVDNRGTGAALSLFGGSAVVANNISANNTGGVAADGLIDIHHNNVYGNSAFDYFGVSPGTGSLAEDPHFRDPAAGDYQLREESGCIDAGDDAAIESGYDLAGFARTRNAHVDLGAYEYQNSREKDPPTTLASRSPQLPMSGWYRSPVVVTLKAIDNPNPGGTGVKSLTFSASGAQAANPITVPGNSAMVTIYTEGTTRLTFHATDLAGNIEPAKTIEIHIDTTLPVATAGALATNEDTPRAVFLTGSDALSGVQSFAITAFPSHGTLQGNGSSWIYSPHRDYHGPDSLEFRVTDRAGNSSRAQVTIDVRPVNDSPESADDTAETLVKTPVSIPVLNNDTDVDGDTLTVHEASTPQEGEVVIGDGGVLVYTPRPGFIGEDAFSYTVADGNGGVATGRVTVKVSATPNRTPYAAPDTVVTSVGKTVEIDVLRNDSDPDGDSLHITRVSQGSYGRTTLLENGKVSYTPFTRPTMGQDLFSYTVSDGRGGVSTTTVTVIILK